jgi:hypothetical protein
MSPSACLAFAYNPSHPWPNSTLGSLLKNEHGAGHVREASDRLVSRLFYRSFKLKGRYELPALSSMFIKQMLDLL